MMETKLMHMKYSQASCTGIIIKTVAMMLKTVVALSTNGTLAEDVFFKTIPTMNEKKMPMHSKRRCEPLVKSTTSQ